MKRGDVRADGRVFWAFDKSKGREVWMTPESFARKKEYCRVLFAKRHKMRMADDPEYAEKRRAWGRKENKKVELSLLKHARIRAKKYGREFNLTVGDVVVPDFCPILGIPLVKSADSLHTINSPSLDRINNLGGYTKDNVMVVSHLANSMKNQATKEHLIAFAKYVLANVNSL